MPKRRGFRRNGPIPSVFPSVRGPFRPPRKNQFHANRTSMPIRIGSPAEVRLLVRAILRFRSSERIRSAIARAGRFYCSGGKWSGVAKGRIFFRRRKSVPGSAVSFLEKTGGAWGIGSARFRWEFLRKLPGEVPLQVPFQAFLLELPSKLPSELPRGFPTRPLPFRKVRSEWRARTTGQATGPLDCAVVPIVRERVPSGGFRVFPFILRGHAEAVRPRGNMPTHRLYIFHSPCGETEPGFHPNLFANAYVRGRTRGAILKARRSRGFRLR